MIVLMNIALFLQAMATLKILCVGRQGMGKIIATDYISYYQK